MTKNYYLKRKRTKQKRSTLRLKTLESNGTKQISHSLKPQSY